MDSKNKIKLIILSIIIFSLVLIPIYSFKIYKTATPKELYRVYLKGKNIGVITSKEELEKYIDDEQVDLKNEYNVDTIYPPNELYISKFKSYYEDVTSAEEIYNLIKEKESFTIKGYIVSMKKDDDTVVNINILNKKDFENAVTSFVKSFVPSEELDKYLDNEDINEYKKIENLYIKEKITITEAFIPSNEKIYTDEKSIIKYLLFSDNTDEKKYIVKKGDTISSIANNNNLAVEEFLIVNPSIKSENSILSVGEEVSVSLIKPIITIVEEVHLVEEQVVKYETEITYDSTMPAGQVKIIQEGKDGLQVATRKIQYENGDIIKAVNANTLVLSEPIKQIKIIGSMNRAVIDEGDLPPLEDWYWPTVTNPAYCITSYFGPRWGTVHDAVDISCTGNGSPIFAANNGIVYRVFYENTGGNTIIIAHEGGYYTYYCHLSSQLVKAGQTIKRGDKIGTMGCTGTACTGPHLHFGTFKGIPYGGGVAFNPLTLYR